jgi:hypothetical protein
VKIPITGLLFRVKSVTVQARFEDSDSQLPVVPDVRLPPVTVALTSYPDPTVDEPFQLADEPSLPEIVPSLLMV